VSSEDLARRIAAVADSKGAVDIVALDVSRILGYTDVLVICTARNERQVRAVAEEVQLKLKHDDELLARRVEGLPEARWVLVDYLDCILHVFVEEARDLYRLDQLWGEASRIELDLPQDPSAKAIGEG
jgi:ribosome-associated protein